MSRKDLDRFKVLHAVEKGLLAQKEAGMQLRLSERWVRKLLARWREEGERGMVRRLRRRAPKRRLPEAVRQRVAKLVKRKYADFGPTLAAEYLAELHGVQVGKETPDADGGGWRRCMCGEPGGPAGGELVQCDTSEHDWLEGGTKLYLLAMVDDTSSRAPARFAAQDMTLENSCLLISYLARWGRPVEFFADKDSTFTDNRPFKQAGDEAWPEALTQIGRALRELGIGCLPAHSLQAKDRV